MKVTPEPGTINGSPEPIKRFSALTQLQYDRFKQWKNGNFTAGTPITYTDIDNVHPMTGQNI
jgi:hypothetical protein